MLNKVYSELLIKGLEIEFHQDLFEQVCEFTKDQQDGVDVFIGCVAYYENLTNYLDGSNIYFDDYQILLQDSEYEELPLSRDKCIWLYHHLMMNCSYSHIYAQILGKALDLCVPF